MIILPLIYEAIGLYMDVQSGSFVGLIVVVVLGVIAGIIGSSARDMRKNHIVGSGLIWIGITFIVLAVGMSGLYENFSMGIFEGLFTNLLFNLVIAGAWITALIGMGKKKAVEFETVEEESQIESEAAEEAEKTDSADTAEEKLSYASDEEEEK